MSSLSTTRSAEFSDDVSMPSFWLTTSDSRCARIWRSNPPSHRPSVSPPTITSLPVVGEGSTELRQPAVAADVEDHVVATLPVGEVLARVVDDVVGTDGSDHVHLRGAAHTRDFSTERLGDLHREGADASRRADDEHLLPRLHLRLVAHGLQRGDRRDRAGGSLLEREVRGLGCELAHRGPRVLGEGAIATAVDLIARRELGHVLADGLDRPGETAARIRSLRRGGARSPRLG